MKKLLLLITLCFLGVNLLSQTRSNISNIPPELYRYYMPSRMSVFNKLIGDTISFVVPENIHPDYKLDDIYNISIDTVWIKKIKNKTKAKIGKHYKLTDQILVGKEAKFRDIIGKKFVVCAVENSPDISSVNTASESYIYLCLSNINDSAEIKKLKYNRGSLDKPGKNINYIIEVISATKHIPTIIPNDAYRYLWLYEGSNPKQPNYKDYIRVKYENASFFINTDSRPRAFITYCFSDDSGAVRKYSEADMPTFLQSNEYEKIKRISIEEENKKEAKAKQKAKIDSIKLVTETYAKLYEERYNAPRADRTLSIVPSFTKTYPAVNNIKFYQYFNSKWEIRDDLRIYWMKLQDLDYDEVKHKILMWEGYTFYHKYPALEIGIIPARYRYFFVVNNDDYLKVKDVLSEKRDTVITLDSYITRRFDNIGEPFSNRTTMLEILYQIHTKYYQSIYPELRNSRLFDRLILQLVTVNGALRVRFDMWEKYYKDDSISKRYYDVPYEDFVRMWQ